MSTQYDYWIYQQEEPDDILRTGNYKQHKPTKLAEKWHWIDSLTVEERQRMKDEFDNEQKNQSNDW